VNQATGSAPRRARARILHVGPLPPPVGGVAAALQMIIACPALREFEHCVVNTSSRQVTETVGQKSLTTGRALRRLRRAVQVARCVRRSRPDIVHFQMGAESLFDVLGDFMVLWAGAWQGARLILHLHTNPAAISLPGQGRGGQWLFRLLSRPARAILVLTDAYRAHLLAGGVHQPVWVVPNMCDETLLSLPPDRSQRPEGLCVIYLGRLTRAKGFFDLLRVAARLRRDYPQIHFEAAGLPSSPEDERWIREFTARESLQETVSLLGLVMGAAKADLFARADILLAPSYGESFGITAVEAMAAGLVVVGTRVSGFLSTVVDSETGYLFEPGDVQGPADCLVRLLAEPAIRQRMGAAARQRYVACFSTDHVGQLLAEAYHQVLSGH